MKVVVLCNSVSLALPMISKLQETEQLVGIAIPAKHKQVLKPVLKATGLPDEAIHLLTKEELKNQLQKIANELKPDAFWTLTFPWKVPDELLKLGTYGFVNFHFGILPEYAGADPVFWQLKNGEKEGGISVHQMTSEIDEGPVYLMEKVPIVPGENHGLHCNKLGDFVASLKEQIEESLKQGEFLKREKAGKPKYFEKPVETDLKIDWEKQTATEIENQINAANPIYGGAITTIGGMELRLLEISPATLNQTVEAVPGQIIHADSLYGLIVACKNEEYIRVNVAHMSAGYVSGTKLFNLGLVTGEKFS